MKTNKNRIKKSKIFFNEIFLKFYENVYKEESETVFYKLSILEQFFYIPSDNGTCFSNPDFDRNEIFFKSDHSIFHSIRFSIVIYLKSNVLLT